MKTSSEKIKRAVATIDARLQVLRKALFEAVADGVASASVSNGGASQSFTRLSITDLRQSIADLESAKESLLNHGKRRTLAPNFQFSH